MKILKYIILSFSGLFFTAGCSDWLEVKPYDTMAEGDLLSTEEGFVRDSTIRGTRRMH